MSTFQTPGGSKRSAANFEFSPVGVIHHGENNNVSTRNSLAQTQNGSNEPVNYQERDNHKRLKVKNAQAQNLNNGIDNNLFEEDSEFEEDSNLLDTPMHALGFHNKENIHLNKNSNNTNGQNGYISPSNKENELSKPIRGEQERISELEKENHVLKIKLNTLQKFVSQVGEEGRLQILEELSETKTKLLFVNRELNKLKEVNVKLEEELIEKGTAPVQNSKMHDQELEASKKELGLKLKQQFEKEFEEKYKNHLKTNIQELKQKFDDEKLQLTESINLLTKKEDVYHKTIKELNIEKEKLHEIKKSLESEVDKSLKIQADLNSKLSTQNSKIDELKQTILKLELELKDTKESLENALSKVKDTMSSYERKLDFKNKEIESLTNQNKDLESSLQAFTEKANEYKDANKETVDALKNQVKDYQENIHNLSNEKMNLELKIVDQESQYSTKIETLKSQIDDLEKHKETFENNRIETMNDLKSKIENLELELKAFKKVGVHNEDMIKNLENQLAEKSHTITFLNDKVNKKDKGDFELSQKIRSLEEKNQALNELNIDAERALNKANTLNSELVDDSVPLKRQIKSLASQLTELQKTNKILQDKFSERSNQSFESRNFRKEVENLNSELDTLKHQIQKLRNKNNDLIEEKLELSHSLKNSETEKNKINQEFDILNEKFEILNDNFETLKTSNFKLDDSLISAKKQNHKLEKYRNQYLKEIQDLQQENLNLRKKILDSNKTESRNTGYDYDKVELQKYNDKLESQVELYKTQYHREVNKNNDMKVMNAYLSKVLRASTQKVRMDLLKAGSEFNLDFENQMNSNYNQSKYYTSEFQMPYTPKLDKADYYNYTSNNLFPNSSSYQTQNMPFYARRRHLRKKFKSASLVVLACIRLKNMTLNSKNEERKILQLKAKIQDKYEF